MTESSMIMPEVMSWLWIVIRSLIGVDAVSALVAPATAGEGFEVVAKAAVTNWLFCVMSLLEH